MYLSKVTLDPNHSQARRDLGDPYEMHRTLARVFAPDDHTPPDRFLWRAERTAGEKRSSVVLVQSERPGDWGRLAAIPGYVLETVQTKAFDLDNLIGVGRNFRFRVYANPTVTRKGQRLGLVGEVDQIAWLSRQGERMGFRLVHCVRAADDWLKARQGKSGRLISVRAALFEGMLEVTDADSLRRALMDGVGHAKVLGLGLISLARV
ncbi:MAG: type I-E CRISPR-associated protein Cas6/Cse3/CasE [Hydrogenophaga sp.]|nr:type I-E CRISPR-associated protein Cas6/Cse3/CasE [Hydrogenophaga sp.]